MVAKFLKSYTIIKIMTNESNMINFQDLHSSAFISIRVFLICSGNLGIGSHDCEIGIWSQNWKRVSGRKIEEQVSCRKTEKQVFGRKIEEQVLCRKTVKQVFGRNTEHQVSGRYTKKLVSGRKTTMLISSRKTVELVFGRNTTKHEFGRKTKK